MSILSINAHRNYLYKRLWRMFFLKQGNCFLKQGNYFLK
nr:MAG TPA: hypothetical protein [Caudoviricetes sp.]